MSEPASSTPAPLPAKPVAAPEVKLATEVAASFVVFLVAVPLSLGIAVASGMPVQAGLIAAVVGGLVVGTFGGAPLQVSGPAAGLTVMVFGFVQQYGVETLSVIVIFAGLMQIAMGLGKVARAALIISPAVLHAMLAGIGILISLGQLHVLLGGKPGSSAFANLQALPQALSHVNGSALTVGLVTLGVLLAWNRFVAPHFKAVPGSLVAILAGTAASFAVPGEVARVALAGNILADVSLPTLGGHGLGDLIQAALALTVVASAESLLCAVATDQLHNGPRANLDRELFAQGLGNTVSGLLGGVPITGVIVRSSANIAAGGRTKLSAILHGVWVAVFVLLGTGLLTKLPMAALGALLVHVGVNLVKVHEMRKLAEFNELLIYGVTLLGVVFINLLWGIGLGFALALVMLLRRISKLTLEQTVDEHGDVHVRFASDLSFLSVPAIMSTLQQLPAGKTVHVTFDLEHLDHASVEAIRAWRTSYERGGGTVVKEPLHDLWQRASARAH